MTRKQVAYNGREIMSFQVPKGQRDEAKRWLRKYRKTHGELSESELMRRLLALWNSDRTVRKRALALSGGESEGLAQKGVPTSNHRPGEPSANILSHTREEVNEIGVSEQHPE